jgi:ATP-binding protein involved in chromosome partitioning
MAYFIAPGESVRHEIFGSGGGEKESLRLGVPFLASLPLDPCVRIASDAGTPVILSNPENRVSSLIAQVAVQISSMLKLERSF